MNKDEMITQLRLAKHVSKSAHLGQFRRDGITPYFNHIEAVVSRIEDDDVDGKIVAYLHDVIEDTQTTSQDLLELGFSMNLVAAVIRLTKQDCVSYKDYLMDILADPIARRVKIADMLSNLSDKPSKKQILKYAKGLIYLHEDI